MSLAMGGGGHFGQFFHFTSVSILRYKFSFSYDVYRTIMPSHHVHSLLRRSYFLSSSIGVRFFQRKPGGKEMPSSKPKFTPLSECNIESDKLITF